MPRSCSILLALDKYKGSISATDACAAIEEGIYNTFPDAIVVMHPIADGGDGSIEILKNYLPFQSYHLLVKDPLNREINASYIISKGVAYIELSIASGIALLEENERNPLYTSSYGTGQLVLDAISKGVNTVVFLLGGSSTNDAGIGIASALGFQFYTSEGLVQFPTGVHLPIIERIVPPTALPNVNFSILCDVDNPFYGEKGAAYIYARQKGADNKVIKYLDEGMMNIARIFKSDYGIDVQSIPGSGAAGGIAGGLAAMLGGSIKDGFSFIADASDFESNVKSCDAVITGEGMLDHQSIQGKVVGKIAELALEYQKKCFVITGMNSLSESELAAANISKVWTIKSIATDKRDAMSNAKKYLTILGERVGEFLKDTI